jgi:hypothetical protein
MLRNQDDGISLLKLMNDQNIIVCKPICIPFSGGSEIEKFSALSPLSTREGEGKIWCGIMWKKRSIYVIGVYCIAIVLDFGGKNAYHALTAT